MIFVYSRSFLFVFAIFRSFLFIFVHFCSILFISVHCCSFLLTVGSALFICVRTLLFSCVRLCSLVFIFVLCCSFLLVYRFLFLFLFLLPLLTSVGSVCSSRIFVFQNRGCLCFPSLAIILVIPFFGVLRHQYYLHFAVPQYAA